MVQNVPATLSAATATGKGKPSAIQAGVVSSDELPPESDPSNVALKAIATTTSGRGRFTGGSGPLEPAALAADQVVGEAGGVDIGAAHNEADPLAGEP